MSPLLREADEGFHKLSIGRALRRSMNLEGRWLWESYSDAGVGILWSLGGAKANQVTETGLRVSLRARTSAGCTRSAGRIWIWGRQDCLSPQGRRHTPAISQPPLADTSLHHHDAMSDGRGVISDTIPIMSMENVAALHLPQKFNPSHNPSWQILQIFHVKSIPRRDAL